MALEADIILAKSTSSRYVLEDGQTGSPTRPQASYNRRRNIPLPPTPELPRQLDSRVGYVEDSVEPRTTLEDIWTIVNRLVKMILQLGRRRVKTGGVPSGVR